MQEANPLVWIGFLAFFVVALVVGVRLLLLASRTRRLPELCIGVGVLGIGPVGFGLFVLADAFAADDAALHSALVGLGMAAVALGVGCKYVFNWRVYHPESIGVQTVVWIGLVALLVTYVDSALQGFANYRESDDWSYLLRTATQIGALLWGSVEALVYWSRMRRRVRLDLADPVVANRFLLWGIGAGAAGVGSLIGTVAQFVLGNPTTQVPWVLASSSAHGLVAAVAMWLAFVPPPAYVRLVQRRARAAAPAA